MSNYKVQDMPESERPREKLKKQGVNSLTNVDLISLIIRTGTRKKNVKELSGEIVREFGIQKLSNVCIQELKRIEGISNVKAGQIIAAGELSRRMKREERQKIEDLEDASSYFKDMKFLEKEVLRVVFMNNGNEIVGEKEFDGGVSKVSVGLGEIFENLLKNSASAFILAHNHPSGKSSPTERDIEFTEETQEVGNKLGVELLDHLIIGKQITSIRRSTEIFKKG